MQGTHSFIGRYDAIPNVFDTRGMPIQFAVILAPVAMAKESIWGFVQSFSLKARATESFEQSVRRFGYRTFLIQITKC